MLAIAHGINKRIGSRHSARTKYLTNVGSKLSCFVVLGQTDNSMPCNKASEGAIEDSHPRSHDLEPDGNTSSVYHKHKNTEYVIL